MYEKSKKYFIIYTIRWRKFLKGLNEKQSQAVYSIGNTVVISGAGAGKTTVFVNKLQHILKSNYPSKILALTFTEKASNEFKQRLNSHDEIKYLGTFHSVFYKLIRSITSYEENGYSYLSKMYIYDEYKYTYYLENSFDNDLFEDKQFKVKVESLLKLNNFISNNLEVALKCKSIDEYFEKMNQLLSKETHFDSGINIVKAFYEQKREDGVLNFDDILIETYFLLKENDVYRTSFKTQFKHILIDEFQDSNRIVLEIIEMIQNNNVFMVGDPYQNIYSFQGSDFNKTLELTHSTNNVIQLDTNYRSSEYIVDFSNSFIESSIKSKSDKQSPVSAYGAKTNNPIVVLENISDFTIPELIYKSGDALEDICILARNNRHLEEIEDILEKWNVPYKKKNHQELEYFLYSILLIIKNDYAADDVYFQRFDIQEWKKIIASSDSHTTPDMLEIIDTILKTQNIANYLSNRGYIDLQDKFDIWQDKILKVFSQDDTELFLKNVEVRLNNYLEQKNYIEKSGVEVMTIHKSKGLEFNTVILYNFEDGVFPRNIDDEEEKRLYYVAITRAKEKLIITSKKSINTYTKSLLDKPYIEHKIISKQNKYILNFENPFIDNIAFGGKESLSAIKMDSNTYEKKYKGANAKLIINNYIKETNKVLQNLKVKNINQTNINDIELMLLDIKKFKFTNEIDNIALKKSIDAIDTNSSLFFNEERINYDYINNTFTEAIHHIINYQNWTDIDKERDDALWLKRFKKLVLKHISKKYTDITKDKSKKSLEIRQFNINKKLKNKQLSDYDDFVANMKNSYYEKSDKEKKYFTTTVLGMHDTLNDEPMIDLSDDKHHLLLRDSVLDFEFNPMNGGYSYSKETLMGSFINSRKKVLANKRWAKIKYLEHMNRDKRASFITLTLPSHWHRWKTKAKSLKEERNYGDKAILEDNQNYKMQGHNLEEHLINSAKAINEIWTYFYHILKTSISNYQKKNPDFTDADVAYFRQLEPHKNLSAHIHILLFADDEITHLVVEAFNKAIEKHSLNSKFCDYQRILKVEDIKNTNFQKLMLKKMKLIQALRQLKDSEASNASIKSVEEQLEVIDKKLNNNIASPASYIAKYTMKSAFSDSDNEIDTIFFNAWESMLGSEVKITGISNYNQTTQLHLDKMYKWYQEHAPHVLKAMKRTGKPMYYWLEKEELSGNFVFKYERRVKEGFKNAEFIKDVNTLFLNSLQSDKDDKELWENATNEVLNDDTKNYTQIRTDKKIVGFYVSKAVVDRHLDTAYVLKHNIDAKKFTRAHFSYLSTEQMIQDAYDRANSNLEFVDGKLYQKLYVEDMYIKGYIDENEIMSFVDFTIDESYLSKIQNYPNHKENIHKEMLMSLKSPPKVA